jgi:hypothetical protein
MSQRHRIATILLLSSTALASPASHAAPPPDSKAKPELLELRREALGMTPDQVKEQLRHFKPLCDAEGYPLVGNVRVKGEAMQPSVICRLVREHVPTRVW